MCQKQCISINTISIYCLCYSHPNVIQSVTSRHMQTHKSHQEGNHRNSIQQMAQSVQGHTQSKEVTSGNAFLVSHCVHCSRGHDFNLLPICGHAALVVAKVGPGARAKVGAAFGAGGLFGRDTFVIAEVRPVTITKVGTALHFSDPYLLIRGQTALVVAKVGPGARAKVGASFGAFCPLGSDTFVVAEVRPVTITKVGTALHFSDPYLLIRGQTALVVAKVGPGARAKVGASFGAFCPLGSDTFVVAEVRPVTITKVGTALHFSDPYLLIRGQTALVVAKVGPGARAKVGASFGALGPLGRATISISKVFPVTIAEVGASCFASHVILLTFIACESQSSPNPCGCHTFHDQQTHKIHQEGNHLNWKTDRSLVSTNCAKLFKGEMLELVSRACHILTCHHSGIFCRFWLWAVWVIRI